MRILLVEDDPMIAKALSESLKEASYAVDWVENGEVALSAVKAQPYDLVLLDLGLPKKDGLVVLAQLRQQQYRFPIIILTARDDLPSRLQGLDGGADDYIIKPFDMAELLARIRVALRKQSEHFTAELCYGSLKLNLKTYQVHHLATNDTHQLTNKEFAILQVLLQHPGVIYSRSDLEDKIYGWGEEVESNAIDFLIHSLRKKLGKEAIKNIRGVGWTIPK
ncbi:response regulator transcription factor [Gallibacterium trehalosifermentans]|uniref:Response regulator transcription factor n=1 Tax=Gallibacterium trehalosifermentans TaxID=516935 RepID=A0ABV6GXU1_9PAST